MAKQQTPEAARIYLAADQWKATCLLQDGSLFTPNQPIWSAQNLAELQRRFIDQPDTGPASFLDKFEGQLRQAADSTIQLAAEVLFVHFLIAVSIGGSKKREIIQTVLGWMDSPTSIPDELSHALDTGLCHPGLSFNTGRPFHAAQIILFAAAFKELDTNAQSQLVDRPFAFRTFLEQNAAQKAGTQRHALLHLVHPDTFEDIVSDRHKQLIAEAFGDRVEESSDDLDREILEIRRSLEQEVGNQISFYSPTIRPLWQSEAHQKPNAFKGSPLAAR